MRRTSRLKGSIAVLVAVAQSASVSLVEAQTATDVNGGVSPVPSSIATPDRPPLDAPLVIPQGPVPEPAVDGPPTSSAKRGGVRVDLWVPDSPVSPGTWLPVGLRVTNESRSAVRYLGDVLSDPCITAITTRLSIHELFPEVVGLQGNGLAVAREFLTAFSPGTLSFGEQRLMPNGRPCVGQAVESSIPPGGTALLALGVVPAYVWRDQPLPAGMATVTAEFRFWRPSRGQTDNDAVVVRVRAPVAIAGVDVAYPSPQAVIEAALSVPEVASWLETRDLDRSWNLTVSGIFADREDDSIRFADIGYTGGPAPVETVKIGIAAQGDGFPEYAVVDVNPWSLAITSVSFPT